MQGSWRLYFLAFLAGSCLCLYEQFQPFHLKLLQLEDFSAETELALRNWSDSFLAFHPAWLLAKNDLKELERNYPLTIAAEWKAAQGILHLKAVPFEPAMKLIWHHTEYLTGKDGTAWRSDLWTRALSVEIPDLPVLNVGSTFPLMADSELDASSRLKVHDLELARRGGEDIVTCVFVPAQGKGRFSFTGLVSGLEKSLIVVRQLAGEKPDQNIAIDATYADKIISRRENEPEAESPQAG